MKTSIYEKSFCVEKYEKYQFQKKIKSIAEINANLKGNFGYCPRASFLRRETGKGVHGSRFSTISNSHQCSDQIRLRQMDISAFSEQNKVT